MFPLVLARRAKVEGNDCGTNTFVPISDAFEDIPSCFRTGLSVARRSQTSLVRKGCETRNYCMHKLGRWDGQCFSFYVCSLALGSLETGIIIDVA